MSAISEIEGSLETVVDSMLRNESLTITLNKRPSHPMGSSQRSAVSFPGRTAHEAWKFTVFLRVLERVHEALFQNTTATKRDIYYQDVELFGKQSVVDKCVDELHYHFNVPPGALNVVSSPTRLMAGSFVIERVDGTKVEGSCNRALLLPEVHPEDTIDLANVEWILVVEKEAVFHKLISGENGKYLATDGILITGKGYPDVSTRQALHRLSRASGQRNPPIPIYGLVDYDPDGFNIFNIYKHGSQNHVHANRTMTVPGMRWLGPKQNDIFPPDAVRDNGGLLQLTGRDRRRATGLLERSTNSEDLRDEWPTRDLRVMLMLNMKAEIEAMYAHPGGFVQWVRRRLYQFAP